MVKCNQMDVMPPLKVKIGKLEVPFFNRIVNLGYSFEKTAFLIDHLQCQSHEKEWEKVKILIDDFNYITFLARLSRTTETEIANVLNEFYRDGKFRTEFSQKMNEYEKENNPYGGDVRFHSLTLYVLVRILEPEIMIETGVANGKSSSLILCAMEQNRKGRLISIDLPNQPGRILPDGGKTNPGNHNVGWLVPDYLKKRWDLLMGDSKELLPQILIDIDKVDMFLHDSLHTYEHVKLELNTILPKLGETSLILCDNIDLGAGLAFNEFLNENNLIGYAYRDFAGTALNESYE